MRRLFLVPFLLALGASAPAMAQCAEEDTLAEAALELALERELTGAALTRALRTAGSDLPHGWARRFHDRADAEAWLRQLDADAPLACGWAERPGVITVVAGARAGTLEVEGDSARATVVDGFREAHLVVRDGDDRLHRLALEQGEASLVDLERPLVVQLVATGPRGPRPIAERRSGAPATPQVAGSGPFSSRLDALRSVRGASPLRPNRLLTAAANRHARAICAAGVAAHRLERSDPESRLASEGIEARVVGEAVARVAPGADALQALVESPGHAAALTDRRFTDVGVGEATARGRRCVVVSLAAWPRFVGRR
ncbi:MAG: hypothetical protein JJ863_29365 [Deltaproteobacteria bacterium]|nr:hypothetical protein [Deltaproteobacteria bacterium]